MERVALEELCDLGEKEDALKLARDDTTAPTDAPRRKSARSVARSFCRIFLTFW
jgi:hypothetical protein